MKDLTVFVSSSEAYQDCWRPFFYLMKKFWPECEVPIVLNTETQSFECDGLKIHCTCTGPSRNFGEAFHHGLEHVEGANVLLFMIDYFIMKPVQVQLLEESYEVFRDSQLAALYLVEMTTINDTTSLKDGFRLVTAPGPDRFSFQAALWKKESLKRYVLKHEDPWLSEAFGSRRYKYMGDRVGFVTRDHEPFSYLHSGALHKGKWIPETVPELEGLGVSMDWKKRGFYQPIEPSLAERLRKRRKTAFQELRSEAHLLGLKYGMMRGDRG